MKAAQATGRIVNPMEAVAGLAKAYKEGVLTQAELAQIESDLGGKLRTNQLDALIKNYDMYAAMLDKVANSAGSADKEVDVMLTSWDAKAKSSITHGQSSLPIRLTPNGQRTSSIHSLG